MQDIIVYSGRVVPHCAVRSRQCKGIFQRIVLGGSLTSEFFRPVSRSFVDVRFIVLPARLICQSTQKSHLSAFPVMPKRSLRPPPLLVPGVWFCVWSTSKMIDETNKTGLFVLRLRRNVRFTRKAAYCENPNVSVPRTRNVRK